jgi:two-component system, chemotaxis family, chemotaxis protein CheY
MSIVFSNLAQKQPSQPSAFGVHRSQERILDMKKTCLIVEDSSIVRKMARRILEGLGFEVVEAEDGVDALVVCKRAMPEAILLDWNMPVMDGYEFLGNLRRMPGGDEPKVVFCTTENGIDHITQAIDGGANEYIMKPFDKEIIAAKFQEVGLIELVEPSLV